MKKSELKSGMVVETKTKRYLVVDTRDGVKLLLSKDGSMALGSYNDDLTSDNDEWTINKVYQPSTYQFGMKILNIDHGFYKDELLWERKESYKFNDPQLEVLAPYRHDYIDWWFAKDDFGDLRIFAVKPKKEETYWSYKNTGSGVKRVLFEHLFDDYDWETEPIQLKDIFKGTKYE